MHPTNVVAAVGVAGEQVAIYVLTAGVTGTQIGFTTSFGGIGTIVPDDPLFGDFDLNQTLTDSNLFFFGSSPAIQPDTDDSWERTEITGTFANGAGTMIYIRANRTTYTPVTGAVTQWEFGLNALGALLDGNIYDVKTFRP